MSWREYCVEGLDQQNCFVSAFHKSRFIEMFDRVKYQPFFTKGLCKCLFLSAWDQEHTNVMKNMLQELIQKKCQDVGYMLEQGKEFARHGHVNEKTMYELAEYFLTHPNCTPDESWLMSLSRGWVALGDSALQASEVIDKL
ncbi:MAG: hypothetical protein ACOYBE_07295 [Blautia sp.]